MKIEILELIDGAKKAKGLTVIIDVFRAMTVEAYLINNGAKDLIPIGNISDAYKYKELNPNTVLIGERGGAICPGFDYGNSPSSIKDVDFTGKTVVHTTSAGTQGIANAINADKIITGSIVNARAIADYIKNSGFVDVSLVCMGLEGKESTEEDLLCAKYIKSLVDGSKVDFEKEVEIIKNTSGAKFFDVKQHNVFPEQDFYLCLEKDKFNFVLDVQKGSDGFMHTKKI